MRKSKGIRAKTRSMLKKEPRERGKIGLSKLLLEYGPGDKVVIKADSGVHKGMPHCRYVGKIGTVINKRGGSCLVGVRQGEAIKEIIVRPEHITPHKEE
jgi:large subunit ribosomal protein L21e